MFGLDDLIGGAADVLGLNGPPASPDYKKAAEQAALGNRPNQSNPYGSLGWNFDPASGQWQQTQGFSGALAGLNSGLQGQAAGAWANPLDNGQQARQHAEDAIYSRAASRLDPMWDQRQHGMNTDLINQGIDPNSLAYSRAQDNFGRQRNDAYSSAMLDAIMGGGQEASRQQGMDIQSRMAPLNAMNSMRGLLQMPGFQSGPDYLQAAALQGNHEMQADQISRKRWQNFGQQAGALGDVIAAL